MANMALVTILTNVSARVVLDEPAVVHLFRIHVILSLYNFLRHIAYVHKAINVLNLVVVHYKKAVVTYNLICRSIILSAILGSLADVSTRDRRLIPFRISLTFAKAGFSPTIGGLLRERDNFVDSHFFAAIVWCFFSIPCICIFDGLPTRIYVMRNAEVHNRF